MFLFFNNSISAIDEQGRLFALPEVDEEDDEPVLFESEQIWFGKNDDNRLPTAPAAAPD